MQNKKTLTAMLIAVSIFMLLAILSSAVLNNGLLAVISYTLGIIVAVMIVVMSMKDADKLYAPDIKTIGKRFRWYHKGGFRFQKAYKLWLEWKLGDCLRLWQEMLESGSFRNQEQGILEFFIARCYQLMGYAPNSIRYFEPAIEHGIDNDAIRIFYARALTSVGDFDGAVEQYGVLEERSCEESCLYTDIGRVYLKKGDGEKALGYFKLSMERFQNYAFALSGCAIAYLMLKNMPESERYVQLAILNHLDSPEDFYEYYEEVKKATFINSESQQ